MSPQSREQVVSGVPYVVTSVNDGCPESLDDFVRSEVIAVTATYADRTIVIHGPARREEDSVVVHEKDNAGVGKDIRTWRVRKANGVFEAFERSVY